jgi:predicted transcriptional regulator
MESHLQIETEEQTILAIKRGMSEIVAGRTVSHAEAMKRIRSTIQSAAGKGNNTAGSDE